MMENSLIILSAALLSFFGVCFIVFKAWPDLTVERHRLYLFELRYQLFELAKSGKVEFNSKAYRVVEESINLHIRHLHSLTLSSIGAVYIAQKWHGQKFERSLVSPQKKVKQSNVSSEVKDELVNLLNKVDAVSVVSTFKRNLLAWCLINVVLAIRAFSRRPVLKRMEVKAYRRVSPLVDSEIKFEEIKASGVEYALNP